MGILGRTTLSGLLAAALVLQSGCGDDDKTINPDVPPLEIVAVTPAADEINVPGTSSFQVVFSAPIDLSSLDTTSFVLDPPIDKYLWANHDTIRLRPSGLLACSTYYTATVAATIRGRSGGILAEPYVFSVTTAPCEPLEVVSITPAHNETDVARKAEVHLVFSEPLYRLSFADLTCEPVGITGYRKRYDTLQLILSGPLMPSTLHTVTVAAGVRGQSGGSLKAPFSFSFSTSSERILNVPVDYPTIKGGMIAAEPGDTVLVAAGTYYEKGISLVSGVTLLSETGVADCVTINCQGGGVLYGSDVDSNAVVKGFTITNGGAANGIGRGITLWESSPRIVNCDIVNCNYDFGAGIHCRSNCSPTIINCTLSGNSGQTGAGICMSLGGYLTIKHSTFFGNDAIIWGGGLYVGGSEVSLTNCTFSGNSAEKGGSIAINSNSRASVENCILAGSSHGVGLLCSGCTIDDLAIHCTDINGNAGGDWVGLLEQIRDLNGNFSSDPLFIDAENGDLRLQSTSPCAPANNECGVQIGSQPVGP